MKTCFHLHPYTNFHASVTLLCRTKKLGMIYTIWEVFAHFLNLEGMIFGPESGLEKSLVRTLARLS